MARLQLNKSSLAREAAHLEIYRRFLPSLDLKRRQLMAERAIAIRALQDIDRAIADLRRNVGEKLPMLANRDVDLAGLARVTEVSLGTENVVGTNLPVLDRIAIEKRPYALLAKPHWVDATATLLAEMLELQVHQQIARRRVALLERAVRTITQRVNLFEKVLIPRTEAIIRKIRIHLSDAEMAAVVRSKLSKRKHARQEGAG